MPGTAKRTTMRSQFDSLMDDCGFASTIVRTLKTKNAQGQIDETDSTISSTELLWVQPARGTNEAIQQNLNDRTTHLIFQKFSGIPLEANDRITQNTGPWTGLEFDVLNHFIYESHRLTEVQLVVKG